MVSKFLKPMRAGRVILIIGLAALMAACNDLKTLEESGLNPFQEDTRLCPSVRVLKEAARFARFQPGDGRDLNNLEVEAEISTLTYTCDFEDESDFVYEALFDEFEGITPGTASGVTVDMTVQLDARRGAAAGGQPVERLPYFVAVLDPELKIIDKQVFTARVRMAPGAGSRGSTGPEDVELKLPLRGKLKGWQYSVVVGFQLTPEQLDYQRAQVQLFE